MNRAEIDRLIHEGKWPCSCTMPKLIETHISWVLMCDEFVFKIKKPMQYPFLDFSTSEKRKYFCEREVELNQRLTTDMYLDVVPVHEEFGKLFVGESTGAVIDYAVQMKRMDTEREMDILLKHGKVTKQDILSLTERIAEFHLQARIIEHKDPTDIHEKFNDLVSVRAYLREQLGQAVVEIIDDAIRASDTFFSNHRQLLIDRVQAGFVRDCHGDLHSRNIFLYPEPVIFDCIEFNEDFRQIDVLNEIAFLCMDLDAFGRSDLSELCIKTYNGIYPVLQTEAEYSLFNFFKAYRANVRAKVNALRAKSSADAKSRDQVLHDCIRYLTLMNHYLGQIVG
jgi:uncharacterized protein